MRRICSQINATAAETAVVPSAEGKWATNKHWCWTLNNYTEEEVTALRHSVVLLLERKEIDYIVYGFETAETGTPHLQGYVEFKHHHNIREAQFELNVPYHTHFEVRRGTRYQASEYCKKEGNFEEYGVTPVQTYVEKRAAKRTEGDRKWESITASIRRNPFCPLTDLEDREFVASKLKYLEKLQAQCIADRSTKLRNVSCTVYWGPTGTGKSYRAYKYAEEHEPDNVPFIISFNSDRDEWFDGYLGQHIIVIDEFDPHRVNKNFFKRLLDRYPLRLAVKGSFSYANWDTVIITSNYDPVTWYQNEDPLNFEAIQRRLTSVVKLTEVWRPWSPKANAEDLLAPAEDL